MAKYPFIISDETVNEYGFRILASAIDVEQYSKNPVVLYMHERAHGDPKKVIGRASNFRLEGTKTLADIEFDSEEEFAASVEGKVKRGYIKMASMRGPALEFSDDPTLMLEGQTGPTVTKMKLRELSIVDIGGHDAALKLYHEDGTEIVLADFGQKKPKNENDEESKNLEMKELKLFLAGMAIVLGLKEDEATEERVRSEVEKLKTAKVELSATVKGFEDQIKATQKAADVKLVDEAIEKKVLPAHLKEVQLSQFDTNREKATADVNAMIAAAKTEEPEDGKPTVELSADVKSFLDGVKRGNKSAEGKVKAFNEYSEVELTLIQEKSPELFNKLVNDYTASLKQA